MQYSCDDLSYLELIFSVRWKSFGIAKNRALIFLSYVLDICVCVLMQKTVLGSTREMGYSSLRLKNSTETMHSGF